MAGHGRRNAHDRRYENNASDLPKPLYCFKETAQESSSEYLRTMTTELIPSIPKELFRM